MKRRKEGRKWGRKEGREGGKKGGREGGMRQSLGSVSFKYRSECERIRTRPATPLEPNCNESERGTEVSLQDLYVSRRFVNGSTQTTSNRAQFDISGLRNHRSTAGYTAEPSH